MAALSDAEFKATAAEVRRETKSVKFCLPEHLAAENNALAEHCFLAAVLSGADPYPVRPEMFTIPKRRFIFEAMVQLRQIKALTAESLIVSLRATGKLDRCGGEAYIKELASLTLATHNAEYNAKAILWSFIKRRAVA
jgi:replicative DNA helicase